MYLLLYESRLGNITSTVCDSLESAEKLAVINYCQETESDETGIAKFSEIQFDENSWGGRVEIYKILNHGLEFVVEYI